MPRKRQPAPVTAAAHSGAAPRAGLALPAGRQAPRAAVSPADVAVRGTAAAAAVPPYFTAFQERWILDESPLKLAEKSRRIGFTYATSYRAVQKCLTRPPGFTQWVSSRDQQTAKEFVTDYVAKWCRAANIVAKGLSGDLTEVVDEQAGIRAMIVQFERGTRIVSLSSTPEAFAGKGGDVLLDEVDLHQDPGRLIDMAMPCTTWGGQLEAISAYRVNGSPASVFARLCADAKASNPLGWSFYRVTIEDAAAQGLVEKINQVTGAKWTRAAWLADLHRKQRTESAWQSQYLCQPQDDGGALLPYAMLAACEVDALSPVVNGPLPAPDVGPLYLGVDIGRQHDLTVLWVVQRVGDVLWTRYVRELAKTTFREQEAILRKVIGHPRMVRCCIDATGIGAMLAENLQQDFGAYQVEAITFTNAVKLELGMPLLRAFDDRAIRIPALPAVREDLHKVRKTATAAGNVRLEAESDDAGHADRFWSLALALHAAGGESVYFAPVAVDGDLWARPAAGRRESEILAPRRRQPAERDEVLTCL
jgi:phage FluMu gp28-like protein